MSSPDEQFCVELMPDYDQKKKWDTLQKQAKDLAVIFKDEIRRQYRVLSGPLAKNLYMESAVEPGPAPDLSDLSVRRIKEAVYDTFRPELTRDRGRTVFPIEVGKDDVVFSTSEPLVRIPYFGLVRHRPNKKILPSSPTAEASWIMSNVTSMRVTMRNNRLVLVVDSREDPSPKKAPRKGRGGRKSSSKWLE